MAAARGRPTGRTKAPEKPAKPEADTPKENGPLTVTELLSGRYRFTRSE